MSKIRPNPNPVVAFFFTLQELAAMKQVLISMLAKQGDTSNLLGAEKTGAGSAGGGQAQAKRVVRIVEDESPKQPKPTVFVSV